MKIVKSVAVAVSLCAAFSFSAFGATSQEQVGQQAQTVHLAYNGNYRNYGNYGNYKNCWWRNGVRYCNHPKYQRTYYKKCWTGYYGRVHCKYYRN